jgi:hypothetical protein
MLANLVLELYVGDNCLLRSARFILQHYADGSVAFRGYSFGSFPVGFDGTFKRGTHELTERIDDCIYAATLVVVDALGSSEKDRSLINRFA